MSGRGQKTVSVSEVTEDRGRKKQTRKGSEKMKESRCKDCAKVIDDNTEALSCNFCHKWVCVVCLEISEDLYKVLLKNPKAPLLVPCKECGEQVSSLQEMRQTLDQVRISLDETRTEVKNSQFLTRSQLDQLQLSQDITKSQLDQVKKGQDESKVQLSQLNLRVNTLKQDLQKTVKSAVKQEVDNQLGSKLPDIESRLQAQFKEIKAKYEPPKEQAKEEIRDMVAQAVSEERDKERRRPNLMMYNIPEISSEEKDERVQHDRQMASSVLNRIMVVPNVETRIQKVIRMGRREMGSETAKRPLKVILDNIDLKFKFIQNAYKLRQIEDDLYKDIAVSSDRTPQEAERFRKLRAELERRKDNGEQFWRIRRGKLVWISKELEEPKVMVDSKLSENVKMKEGNNSSDSDQDEVFSDDNVAVVISSTDSLRGVQAEMSVAEAIAPEKVSYTMSPVLQDKTHRKSAKGSLLSSSNLQPGGSNQRF